MSIEKLKILQYFSIIYNTTSLPECYTDSFSDVFEDVINIHSPKSKNHIIEKSNLYWHHLFQFHFHKIISKAKSTNSLNEDKERILFFLEYFINNFSYLNLKRQTLKDIFIYKDKKDEKKKKASKFFPSSFPLEYLSVDYSTSRSSSLTDVELAESDFSLSSFTSHDFPMSPMSSCNLSFDPFLGVERESKSDCLTVMTLSQSPTSSPKPSTKRRSLTNMDSSFLPIQLIGILDYKLNTIWHYIFLSLNKFKSKILFLLFSNILIRDTYMLRTWTT